MVAKIKKIPFQHEIKLPAWKSASNYSISSHPNPKKPPSVGKGDEMEAKAMLRRSCVKKILTLFTEKGRIL